ncbi:MAG TPA: hypothetical protein ENK44_13890 [Caldithrix abyssi]|uniref:Uncharacterized protein n=1 Tax=Caldithrix abyssi TaxID=187145 RepID=A0A7V4WWC8_CALAY|nr:hypothetical protein [Caldithrix abyssi]
MSEQLTFDYEFTFQSGRKSRFLISLDRTSLKYIPPEEPVTAEWARLENHRCANCTLSTADHPWCPIALNLVDILPEFMDVFSYEKVDVTVKIDQRTYSTNTSIQQALSSMLGIYMVSSGCPIMSKLRPMVRFHLPFASVEETIYRSVSTYLLGQYFRHIRGEQGDWDLKGLIQIYENIQQVNLDMAERLRSIPAKDANVNALIVLDVFAKELPHNIQDSLKRLEYLFAEQTE